MLELNYEDLKQFKQNLLLRKVPFTIEKKRSEIVFISNGKRIAKAETKNSISHSKKEETRSIINLFANVKKSINKHIISPLSRIVKRFNECC